MKAILIAALLGTGIFSAQGRNSDNQLEVKLPTEISFGKMSKESELKQKIKIELYNLEMLKTQFKIAQNRIRTSPGNHEEIEKDFEYFHHLLLEDKKAARNVEGTEKAIHRLKKEYARKHKIRAAQELVKQKELAVMMQKELKQFLLSYKSIRNQYRKYLNGLTTPELQNLAYKIAESEAFLKESTEKVTRNASHYKKAYKEAEA